MLQIIISKYWIQILVGIKAEYYFEYSLQNYSITRPCNMRLQHAPSGEAALLYLHFCISYSANRKEPSADISGTISLSLGCHHGPETRRLASSVTTAWCEAVACSHHGYHLFFSPHGKLEADAISFSICTANAAPPVIWKVSASTTRRHSPTGMPVL